MSASASTERRSTMVVYVCRGCKMSSLAMLPDNSQHGLPRWSKTDCCPSSDHRPFLARRCSSLEFGTFTAAQMGQDHETVKAMLKMLPPVEEHEVFWVEGGMVQP